MQVSSYGKKFNDSNVLSPVANGLSNMYFNKFMYDSFIEHARQAIGFSHGKLVFLIDAYQ